MIMGSNGGALRGEEGVRERERRGGGTLQVPKVKITGSGQRGVWRGSVLKQRARVLEDRGGF